MKEGNICLKQIKDHIITRVIGWKNMEILDCTIAEVLTKLILFQIVLVMHPLKKNYNQVMKIMMEVRHVETKMMKQQKAMRTFIVTQLLMHQS